MKVGDIPGDIQTIGGGLDLELIMLVTFLENLTYKRSGVELLVLMKVVNIVSE
jgi:hypothetical protein